MVPSCSSQQLLRKRKIKKEANLGLPPGGVAITEVSLGPGRENDGAILLAALGEGQGEGGRAAHNLVGEPYVSHEIRIMPLHSR